MIETFHLTRSFKDLVAVNDLSLTVRDGEILGLLGANGAGKSTTILMLCTVLKPTSGTALVDGFDIVKQPDQVRKRIGICFQDPKLDWSLNCLEILNWHGKICGIDKATRKKRIAYLIQALQLEEYVKKPTWQLSGGIRKKIEVCKVLLQRPKIAFFDEPTISLDPEMKHVVWDFIKELKQEGSTILLATNRMNEADSLSDRIAVLNRGKLVAVDTSANLKDSILGGDHIMIKTKIPIPAHLVKKIHDLDNSIVNVVVDDKVTNVYLNQAEKFVSKILNLISSENIKIEQIEMKEPTLEEVFFKYAK
ncbi:MAG: ATP-binding cassette domain-containing protein [Candidatus Helarchaeales archaeon]